MKRALVFFFLINLFFSSYYIDVWKNANTTSRVLPVLSVVDQGTLKIDSFADKTIDKSVFDGHYFSDKPPLPSFLVIPFYYSLKALGLKNQQKEFEEYSEPVFILGGIICGSLPFALICAVFFFYASKNTNTNKAAILSMLFLYGSFVFIFSGTFFAHVLSACFLLLSYVQIKENKSFFYSGLFLGLAILCDYSVAFIAFIWIAQAFINEGKIKCVLLFALGLLPAAILLMGYNLITTGAPLDLLYNHSAEAGFANVENLGFSYPKRSALFGLTFSPYRGLLIYAPFLILCLVVLLKERAYGKIKWCKNYLLLITIGYLLLISSHKVWWGGWSFGPRQLMPIAVLLLFEGVIFISKRNIRNVLFWSFGIISFGFMWLIKTTVVYSVPTEIKNPFKDYFFQSASKGPTNPNNILTMLFGIQPISAAFIWLALFAFVITYYFFEDRKKIVA